MKEIAKKRRDLSNMEKRIAELDVQLHRNCENHRKGILADERFSLIGKLRGRADG